MFLHLCLFLFTEHRSFPHHTSPKWSEGSPTFKGTKSHSEPRGLTRDYSHWKTGLINFLWDGSSLFCTNSAMLWFSLRILVFFWSFVSADKCFALFSATLHVFCKCFTPIKGDFLSSCEYFMHFSGKFPSISTLEVIFVSFWLLCFTSLLFGCCFFLVLYQFQVVSFACFAHFFAFQHCTRFQ